VDSCSETIGTRNESDRMCVWKNVYGKVEIDDMHFGFGPGLAGAVFSYGGEFQARL